MYFNQFKSNCHIGQICFLKVTEWQKYVRTETAVYQPHILKFSTFHFVPDSFCGCFILLFILSRYRNFIQCKFIIVISYNNQWFYYIYQFEIYKEQIIFAFMYKLKSWYFYARKLVNILLPLSGPLQCHELGSIDSERAPVDV